MTQILNYYKQELGNYGLVFRYMKLQLWGLLLSPILCAFVAAQNKYLDERLWFILSFIPMLTMFYFFNMRAKEVLFQKYKIETNTRMWSTDDNIAKLRAMDKKLLREYMSEKYEIFDEEEAKEYASIASVEAEKRRVKFPYILSALVIVLVPVWSAFLGWYFNNEDIATIDEAILGLIALGSVGFVIIVCTVLIRIAVMETLIYMINIDSSRLDNISELMKEIEIDFRRERKRMNEGRTA